MEQDTKTLTVQINYDTWVELEYLGKKNKNKNEQKKASKIASEILETYINKLVNKKQSNGDLK